MRALDAWPLVVLLVGLGLYNGVCLARNVVIARRTGLRYVLVPFYTYNRILLIASLTPLRLLDRLSPNPPPTSWRRLVASGWLWKLRLAPFRALGTDTFLTVSPGGIVFFTADAQVIAQVIARPAEFPKATSLYKNIDIYGKNILSLEGAAWRHHRRLTSPAFSETNNQLVWNETIAQSQAALASWTGSADASKTIRTLASDTMRLSLHVMSLAGLGRKMEWPKASTDDSTAQDEVPAGHTLSFTDSLRSLLRRSLIIMMLPKWLLRNLPWSTSRNAYTAYEDWRLYMREMIAAKTKAVRTGANDTLTIDLLGQLIKGQEETKEGVAGDSNGLSESEVIGNLFVFIIAGHETTASSIHFSLILLALHPDVQAKVHEELDKILQGRPPAEWDYTRDLPLLLDSLLAAVIAEELRLIPPAPSIPKVVGSTPQPITIDGKETLLPAGTMIRLCLHAVHRNPRFWPPASGESDVPSETDSPQETSDLEHFRPERWRNNRGRVRNLPRRTSSHHAGSKGGGASSLFPETSKSFYAPVRGSYLPFSDGSRACLGRRFAQVEALAALAVLLTQYSVELAVDEWASDAEVGDMTTEEKAQTWQQAKTSAEWTLQNKLSCFITIQLAGQSHVPVRFVRRGQERFTGF